MLRRVVLLVGGLVLLSLVTPGQSQVGKVELVASTPALSPADEKKAFHLPAGFEAQLVAAEPDIAKPMNIAFDERGRLWVTDTLEYPFPAAQGKKPRDTVKILEDFGPDGRARKITTFADGLNIPIGLLPLPGCRDALVYGIPAIYKLSDSDGDGKADRREVLYQKYGSKDTHGMTNAFTWGFDGWVYACHGFANDSTVVALDGSKISMNSGNVYRFRADGARVEQLTWGQVNPFGLSLDPLGNLYSADCHSMPIYQLLRGAYYPSFGKPHDGLGYGPEMMKHLHHSTGIAGITCYAADQFPKEYQGTIFVGNVVTSRINHDRIEWKGSSPRAVEQPDFLRSDDPWFRPVDIKLGPDGALYVADFYNCIIGHYEVPLTHPKRDRHRGRIWRIVYRGQDHKGQTASPRADWGKASLAELVEDLGHPNLTVRLFATHELTRRGKEAVKVVQPVFKPESNAFQRVHGLWVLERLGESSDEILTACCKDGSREVRTHAMRALSERRSLTAQHRALAWQGLKDADAHVRRAAADALGRLADGESIEPLLELLGSVDREDTHLRHVVRMALRNQLRASKAWPAEALRGPGRKWIADVAPGIASPEAARFLLDHLKSAKDEVQDLPRLAEHVARHGDDAMQSSLVAEVQTHRAGDLPRQLALFQAVERGTVQRGGKLTEPARSWGSALALRLLESRDGKLVQAGIALAGSLRLSGEQQRLVRLLLNRATPEDQQLAALEALGNLDPSASLALFGKVLGEGDRTFKVRQQAAQQLGKLNRPEARQILSTQLQTAPAAVQAVIAGSLASNATGAEELLKLIETGKASARLLQDRTVESRVREARLSEVEKRIEKLTAGLPSLDQRVAELIRARREGFARARPDVAQGQKVFEKNCASCHQVGGKGQKIGPQLDGIGIRGAERLLEDTLDPGRNVDQAFRTTVLNLAKGQVIRGLLLREEGDTLILADEQGKEKRISRREVEERSVSPLSPMPGNFADQISEPDFYHLLAYLLAQRAAEK